MGVSRSSSARGQLAAAAIRISALWVLTVALIKLFKGTPGDLPIMVQHFASWLELGLKFQIVIGIELSVVFVALLRPRWGWPLLVGMFTLFIGMLISMIAAGVDSCGCFGGALKMKPVTMLAIDGTCLAAILATRPWSSLRATPLRWGVLVPALAVAWIAPFVAFKNEQLPVNPPGPGTPAGPVAPISLPEFQMLIPDGPNSNPSWVGKHLKETPLGSLIDVEVYPQDAIWILYRITCDHCAKEFQDIIADPERAAKLYVLVRISEPDEEASRQVRLDQYPPIFQEAILPLLKRGYGGQTPWTLEVEAGIVKSAKPGFE